MVNSYKAKIFNVHLYFNELSIDMSHFDVVETFIISTRLRMSTFSVFVNFLEDVTRYKCEIFRVYLLFNDLSNGVSFVYVA